MTKIRIDTERVQDVGRRLSLESDHIDQIIHELQQAIGNLDTWAWDGRSRARAEPMLSQVQPSGRRTSDELARLGRMLERIADTFEDQDNTAARNLAGMPWVDFETQSGDVLGVMTAHRSMKPEIVFASQSLVGAFAVELSKMSWADRFAHAEELRGEIQEFEELIRDLKKRIEECDQSIGELDEQIADLQAQRDALKEEADNFSNKLKRDPDGWQWGFDDGIFDAPWRTRSDVLEDKIDALDEQIQDLEAQRDGLLQIRQESKQKLIELQRQSQELSTRQADLKALINKGVPADGPTKPDWLRNQLSGCTHYVAQHRDVSAWPNASGKPGHPKNACEWDNQARQAGYEVGQKPLKGSILVWEPGAKYTQEHNNYTVSTHSTAGHVAIVEEVDYSNSEVVRVKIGHASLSDGRGTHSDPIHQWVTLNPAEIERGDISFVYDKPAS
jgi:WXG100 family type VII secretion target